MEEQVLQKLHSIYSTVPSRKGKKKTLYTVFKQTIVCPGCGWIGRKNKLHEIEEGIMGCPSCHYAYWDTNDNEYSLPTLLQWLQKANVRSDDVNVGKFLESVLELL